MNEEFIKKQVGRLIEGLQYSLVSPNESDSNLEPANITDGLFAISRALDRIADKLALLGNAGAITTEGGEIGAIEGLSMQIKEGLEAIASAVPDRG